MRYLIVALIMLFMFAEVSKAQEGPRSLLARLDSLEAKLQEFEQVLDNSVVASPVPCEDLGVDWRTYDAAEGRFLLGAGGDVGFNTGDIGGEPEVTLTVEQMPSHSHAPGGLSGRDMHGITGKTHPVPTSVYGTSHPFDWSAGGGGAHTNMPPFVTINFCKLEK